MTNPTSNFGWVMPTTTDLVTDLPADFAVFGQAVDTSMAGLKGGTTGQILSKTSNTDMAFTWTAANPGDITAVTAGTGISGGGTSGDVTVTNAMATALTTKGDLTPATGSGTFARLAVGTNGHTIVADSTAATGLAYKNLVPDQTSNSGKYLTTDGTNTSWGTVTPGGMTLISTTTLSGASVTLSSIPQTYKSLVMYVRNYLPATSGQLLRYRYNADAGANRYGTNDLGVSVSGTFNGTSMYAQIEQNSTTATGFSNITIWDYTNTTTWKYANVLCVSNNSGTSTTPMLGSYWAIYNQTTAISSITLFANSGNLTSGTVLLYGVA